MLVRRVFNEGKRSPRRRLEPGSDPHSPQRAEETASLFKGAFLEGKGSNRVTQRGFL